MIDYCKVIMKMIPSQILFEQSILKIFFLKKKNYKPIKKIVYSFFSFKITLEINSNVAHYRKLLKELFLICSFI